MLVPHGARASWVCRSFENRRVPTDKALTVWCVFVFRARPRQVVPCLDLEIRGTQECLSEAERRRPRASRGAEIASTASFTRSAPRLGQWRCVAHVLNAPCVTFSRSYRLNAAQRSIQRDASSVKQASTNTLGCAVVFCKAGFTWLASCVVPGSTTDAAPEHCPETKTRSRRAQCERGLNDVNHHRTVEKAARAIDTDTRVLTISTRLGTDRNTRVLTVRSLADHQRM